MKKRLFFLFALISVVTGLVSWNFNEPTTFTVSVTQADIDNSSGTSSSTNSLATAILRLNANRQLPGQQYDSTVQNCLVSVTPGVRLMNGNLVSFCDAFVCSATYGTDNSTAVKILLEVVGIKPSGPYTATLTKN